MVYQAYNYFNVYSNLITEYVSRMQDFLMKYNYANE